jgi:hypothetical protein
VSETVTVWEAGCYVDGWWGHYSTARALTVALDLGWTPDDRDTVRLLAEWDLSGVGPAPEAGSWRAQYVERIGAEAEAVAQSQGWSLEEDAGQILRECVEEAEQWLNSQPQTPEGHYWGHSEYGGWGLWQYGEEELL